MPMTLGQWLAQGGDYVLLVCGVFAALGAAATYAAKALASIRRRASRPHDELVAWVGRLEGAHGRYDKHAEHVDACLARDKERLDDIEASSKLTLRALMQLITHELDGNHVDKLAEVRDAIHDHLIER